MKRILFLILGYYLVIQAAITAINIFGFPENTVILLPLAGLSGWGGYWLILLSRASLLGTCSGHCGVAQGLR
jgi:hypothetical protein